MLFELFFSVDMWSCLCWVGVVLHGFCCPFWILCICGSCRVPGSMSASVHQSIAWRNGDGPGGKADRVVGNI